jgi:hypothetical protein
MKKLDNFRLHTFEPTAPESPADIRFVGGYARTQAKNGRKEKIPGMITRAVALVIGHAGYSQYAIQGPTGFSVKKQGRGEGVVTQVQKGTGDKTMIR